MFNPFRRITAELVREDQLYEAKRLALEHRAAAEHHEALAVMYENRVKRLESTATLAEASAS